jgi:hypothetical protein
MVTRGLSVYCMIIPSGGPIRAAGGVGGMLWGVKNTRRLVVYLRSLEDDGCSKASDPSLFFLLSSARLPPVLLLPPHSSVGVIMDLGI